MGTSTRTTDTPARSARWLAVSENSGEFSPALRRLVRQFPDVPPDVVTSLLSDSYCAVVGLTERPLVEKAEDLTRLRLEVRTRHPARLDTDTDPAENRQLNASARN